MNAALSHASVPVIGRANSARGKPFAEVLGEAAERAHLNYDDTVLPLTALRFTEDALLDVPGIGLLELTPWSRMQLARNLGVRWERWFNQQLVSPAERADEVNRRLKRQTATWKVRARRYASTEFGDAAGVLRGFVGPQYAPIDDVRILERLAEVLGESTETFQFVRVDRTARGSYFVALSIEDLDLGLEGARDPHRSGFLVRNSEVGASAVSLFEYLFRLVCTNGLLIQVAGKKLFYQVHRATTDVSLREQLAKATAALPGRWSRTSEAIRAARSERIGDPQERLRDIIRMHREARRHESAVLESFDRDPDPTRFGLVQAITRVAQSLDPEERFGLELVAGMLVVQ